MKRLIVCCDGTWNRPDQVQQGVAAPTNVAKFALPWRTATKAGYRFLVRERGGWHAATRG